MLPDDILNDNIMDYLDSLEPDIPEYLRIMEKNALLEGVPIIRKQAQALIKFFIKLHRPVKILEIGTAVGYSASFMSEYMLPGCTITTIEKMPDRIHRAEENFSRIPRRDDIKLIKGDAQTVLEELSEEKMLYDFIFLDAAKAQYMNYLEYVVKMLPIGGLFLTDNVLQEGSVAQSKYSVPRRERTIHARMREFLYEIKHMKELETVIIPSGDGLSVSYKIMDAVDGNGIK